MTGTKNLLDYAVSHGTKHFCFLSSVEDVWRKTAGMWKNFPRDISAIWTLPDTVKGRVSGEQTSGRDIVQRVSENL